MILFFQAFSMLFAYDILRGSCGFRTVYATVRGWKTRKIKGHGEKRDIVARVCKAVNYACVWYPKTALCLQRSFVTTYMLRSQGVAAQMVLGAQKLPFHAHAWVEVDGQPIDEGSNVQAAYAIWDRC